MNAADERRIERRIRVAYEVVATDTRPRMPAVSFIATQPLTSRLPTTATDRHRVRNFAVAFVGILLLVAATLVYRGAQSPSVKELKSPPTTPATLPADAGSGLYVIIRSDHTLTVGIGMGPCGGSTAAVFRETRTKVEISASFRPKLPIDVNDQSICERTVELTHALARKQIVNATTGQSFPILEDQRVATTGVAAQLLLPVRSVAAGATINGTVVFENTTGQPITVFGCGGFVGATLTTTGTVDGSTGFAGPQCIQQYTIPTGTSRYPVKLGARYDTCSPTPPPGERACQPDGRTPALKPGRYYATVVMAPDSRINIPRAVRVRVTKSTETP